MNYVQFDNIKCTILRYSLMKSTVTLKPELGSLRVIDNNTIASHDFICALESNFGTVLHRL